MAIEFCEEKHVLEDKASLPWELHNMFHENNT